MSALSAMQDKTQHLENSLSAETRIKLDLFSALGDAKRQLEIAQGRRAVGPLCGSVAENAQGCKEQSSLRAQNQKHSVFFLSDLLSAQHGHLGVLTWIHPANIFWGENTSSARHPEKSMKFLCLRSSRYCWRNRELQSHQRVLVGQYIQGCGNRGERQRLSQSER